MKVVVPNWPDYWFQKAPKTRFQAGKYTFMLLILSELAVVRKSEGLVLVSYTYITI